MILFRHCDRRFPFLWETVDQPAARWHGDGEGPVQYLSDTPSGAWAEFLRHESITDERDLEGVQRALWAVDVPLEGMRIAEPVLKSSVLLGRLLSYETCRIEARRLRLEGVQAIKAPSAALKSGGANGWKVDGGEREADPRDGITYALFGKQPTCTGWPVVDAGMAPLRVLSRVRHLDAGS